jgi:hypothetical protein
MDGKHPSRDDRVLVATRALSVFIAPFLVVAFVILYLLPTHTDRLWAWTIAAQMTSMVLASAYLGGAYFFVVAARARHWHEIGTGFLAVTAFASLLGVATIRQWDRFAHGHLSFWLWAGLYFTAPFLVIGAWLANRRYAAPVQPGDVLLPHLARVVIGAVGVLALATGAAMFVDPGLLSGRWPWALTPLTARVMAAVLCLGGAGVAAWWDPRWTTVRLMLQVEAVMVALILLAAVRAHAELIAAHALTWPLLVGVLLMLAGTTYLWVTYELRPPTGRSRAAGPTT